MSNHDFHRSQTGRQRKRKDARTRAARNHNINEAWQRQIPALVRAYLEWKHRDRRDGDDMMYSSTPQCHTFEVTVVGIGNTSIKLYRERADILLGKYTASQIVVQQQDEDANVALAQIGCLGGTPTYPGVAITFDCLELYHQIRRRQSSFSTQAMAKVLCALSNVSVKSDIMPMLF